MNLCRLAFSATFALSILYVWRNRGVGGSVAADPKMNMSEA